MHVFEGQMILEILSELHTDTVIKPEINPELEKSTGGRGIFHGQISFVLMIKCQIKIRLKTAVCTSFSPVVSTEMFLYIQYANV